MTGFDRGESTDRQEAPRRAQRRRRMALALAVLAGLVGLGVLLGVGELGRDLEPGRLMQRIRGLGPWGEAAVVGLMVVHAFVPFPAEILALSAGALYGTLHGTALIWTGAMIGATLSFGLARWLGRPFVEMMVGPESRARVDAWSVEQGAVTLLVVRFIPVIAFNLINYAAGLTRVGWGTFLWTTGVGILPLTAVMVWMGTAMVELSWPWLLGVSAAGIVVVVAGHWWVRGRGWLGDGRGATLKLQPVAHQSDKITPTNVILGGAMVRFLTQREADYCEALLEEFEQAGYLPRLTAAIRRAGLSTDAMPLLFELRFAKALKDRGLSVEYEKAGLGVTTIDFVFADDRQRKVLAELVSIGVSEVAEAGTQQEIDEIGIQWSELILSTTNEDPRLSEEGEVLLVQQKICEKVYRDDQPVKFPLPQGDRFHIVVVDMRGFLGGNGGDNADYVQLTFGNECVEEHQRRFWTDPLTGERVPIRGLFEDTDRPKGAPTLRQRVHGILFTRDRGYADGTLLGSSYLVHNPHLINTQEHHDLLRAAVVG